jgi:hypothetical protein
MLIQVETHSNVDETGRLDNKVCVIHHGRSNVAKARPLCFHAGVMEWKRESDRRPVDNPYYLTYCPRIKVCCEWRAESVPVGNDHDVGLVQFKV